MWWRRIRTLLDRALFSRATAARDIDDEIRFHLAEEERLGADRGLSAAEAARAARRAFGSVASARENTRAVWTWTSLEQLLQDLRLGSRIFTRSPGVSATAVILIALVIGGNTTVFSLAHAVIARPARGVHADRLATVSWVAENGDIETHAGYRVYAHLREHSTALQSVAAFDHQRVTLTNDNGSYAVRAGIVSPNYFETLGARIMKGRSFTFEEAQAGSSGLVVVIAHHLWQNSFAGVDDIIGRPVSLNGRPATIVGVADPEFRGGWLAEMTDVWVPLVGDFRQWLQPNRSNVSVAMFGRRAPGTSLEEAQTELAALWTQLQRAYPELNQQLRLRLVPYSATAGGNSIVSTQGNRILAIFSVITLLTIAIVCANVANLLIARAVIRQREVALRQSLGASRARIVRGLLAEGIALSIVAWAAACLFAWFVSHAVVTRLVPPGEAAIVVPSLTPDWTVVFYALALALVCTIVVTLGPALRTWRAQLLPFLKVGEQSVVASRSRLSGGLVIVQLAFSVLLLTSAGLAQRSISVMNSVDIGFDAGPILMATVNTAGSAEDASANTVLLEALKARIARLPGVDSVSFSSGTRLSSWMTFPVRRHEAAEPLMTVENWVAPDFFATLGVPFAAGGDFEAGGTRPVRSAIITQYVAQALWPGESAVGKILTGGMDHRVVQAEVVGVVRDAFFTGRTNDMRPRYLFFHRAERPNPPGEATFFLRRQAPQEAVAPAVARALREVDARVAIASLRSLETQLASDRATLWMLAMLLTLFAGGSLLIAAIGQYAVVAFDGRRRSREFGVRIALGASAPQLVRSVIGESLRLTAVGLAIGFVLSVGVGLVLSRLLYGITPTDPPTYVGVFSLLAATSVLASYLPARRAGRTDPITVLRTE